MGPTSSEDNLLNYPSTNTSHKRIVSETALSEMKNDFSSNKAVSQGSNIRHKKPISNIALKAKEKSEEQKQIEALIKRKEYVKLLTNK